MPKKTRPKKRSAQDAGIIIAANLTRQPRELARRDRGTTDYRGLTPSQAAGFTGRPTLPAHALRCAWDAWLDGRQDADDMNAIAAALSTLITEADADTLIRAANHLRTEEHIIVIDRCVCADGGQPVIPHGSADADCARCRQPWFAPESES